MSVGSAHPENARFGAFGFAPDVVAYAQPPANAVRG
jgi:hypothetical protein